MKDIIFFSSIEGVADACPVLLANQTIPKWANLAKDNYINDKKDRKDRFNHIFQCPGIFDLYNYGFVVTAWHDFIIKTEYNKEGFAWKIPNEEISLLMGSVSVIGTHQQGISDIIPKRPTALNQIIKINTPWHVIAPKGIKFISIPIAYPDTFEFDSHIGILDPGTSSEINIQLNWNVKDGETLIKAGTPLAHFIPISEEKFNLVCRDATENDKKWLRKRNFFNNFTFKLKRNLIKDFYHKHFNGN
jgi:hypothetical protein